jgi:hypothetical protein
LTSSAAPSLSRTTVAASSPPTLPRDPAVDPSVTTSSRSSSPDQAQTDPEPPASSSDLNSETQENNTTNNDYDFIDLNMSPPSQSTSSAPCQDQARPNMRGSVPRARPGRSQPPADRLSDQLSRHISDFDPNGIYPLPGPSQQTGEFSQNHFTILISASP